MKNATTIQNEEGPIGAQLREKGFDFSEVTFLQIVAMGNSVRWHEGLFVDKIMNAMKDPVFCRDIVTVIARRVIADRDGLLPPVQPARVDEVNSNPEKDPTPVPVQTETPNPVVNFAAAKSSRPRLRFAPKVERTSATVMPLTRTDILDCVDRHDEERQRLAAMKWHNSVFGFEISGTNLPAFKNSLRSVSRALPEEIQQFRNAGNDRARLRADIELKLRILELGSKTGKSLDTHLPDLFTEDEFAAMRRKGEELGRTTRSSNDQDADELLEMARAYGSL